MKTHTVNKNYDNLEITRIDVEQKTEHLLVMRYAKGWTANSGPVEVYLTDETTFEDAKKWCEENWYSVLEWPGGFRAFKTEEDMGPVRPGWKIKKMRRQLDENPRYLQGKNARVLDLAYYC